MRPTGNRSPADRPTSTAKHERRLSHWDEQRHAWRLAPGHYRVCVGASSLDVRLEGAFVEGNGEAGGSYAALPTGSPARSTT